MDAYALAWGTNVNEAWRLAAEKLDRQAKNRKKRAQRARKQRSLSNAELNSGWVSGAMDHGVADSMGII